MKLFPSRSKKQISNKLLIICIYKPPKGSVEECIQLFSLLVDKYQTKQIEIWILGNFNVDMLKHDDINTVRILRFLKKIGLKQHINQITRPKEKEGSCIDLIMTDCIYINTCGILDDFVSDHFTVYIIRKRQKEPREFVGRTVRDYSRFDNNSIDIFIKKHVLVSV